MKVCKSLVLLISFIPGVFATTLVQKKPQLNEHQQAFVDAWAHFVDKYEDLKNIFTKDAIIKGCCTPLPCEEVVGVDAAVLDFHSSLAELHIIIEPITTTANVFTFKWTDVGVTPMGCSSIFHGVGIATFNENGKVHRYEYYSDNCHGMDKCMKDMMAFSDNVQEVEMDM